MNAAHNLGQNIPLKPTTVFVDGNNVTDDWSDFRINFAITNNIGNKVFTVENSLVSKVWPDIGYVTFEEELGGNCYILNRHDGLEIISSGYYEETLTLELTIDSDDAGGEWTFNLTEKRLMVSKYSIKIIKIFQFLLIISIGVLSGCYNPPEFPIEPSIKFTEVIFKQVENRPDSLILTIEFQDGDGNLGLSADENFIPYNDVWYFRKYKEDTLLLTYADRFTPPWDTLPPYEFPYLCQNYTFYHGFEGYEGDTLYFQQNPDHWNIIVKYFIRKNGVYTEFDWETALDPLCSDSFNGRFPILSDQSSNSPLEGRLRYGMTSTGFTLIFRNDTIKLQVSIKDRALNTSNIIETPGFVLKNILIED